MNQCSRLVQYLYDFGLLLSQKTGYLAQNITKEGNMLVTERFLSGVIKTYRKYLVSTDSGDTRYTMACRFLKLRRQIHSFLVKTGKP